MPHRLYHGVFKRALDILLCLVALPPVLLVVGLLALMIRRDGGPAFYLQPRLGRGGTVFHMIKLRSMATDADAQLAGLLSRSAAARAEWEERQKLTDDPRITAVGRLIRKTSLDELPQLFNVLKGDMSLVGPRPMLPAQKDLYPGQEYFQMRPGITGFWQISVRNDSSFRERAHWDGAYFRRVSLVTDLWVMLRTVRVVMTGTGC
ncbi:sugar transferase [Pseudoroseicyclus sp. CLL3-39]|uniref:Sugar transferase n=2 Tax=Pseudoroseicyclus tamaricis TaxID=2705421 RepID=A0A6B2JTG1_9RHOB|nr:sugar transferase [Pseudoroseicyclus tamaricis]